MKTKSLTLSLLVCALIGGIGAAPAMAQNANTPNIDRVQEEIRARIQQGVASGHITQQEAQTLYQREREIQFRELRMKADGSASPQERQALRQDLDAMRAEVERKMTNPRVAGAPDRTPGIDRHEGRIRARIDQGIASGHITRGEARRLYRRDDDIQRMEARFKSDGVVSQGERRQLRRELETLQNDVERLMANDRTRGDGRRDNDRRS
ncbi:MAG: hypothetical protein JWQ23_3165 [Herminiimonas sp.]|nr:hypothetical protein [Herminiimonas sp.]